MKSFQPLHYFQPQSPDAAGVLSWAHLGDLHMTKAGEPNHCDFARIVDEINRVFAESVSFVFLPGDVADDGSRTSYGVVRGELDRLKAPWCAILGDHDVHEKSFVNFLEAMSAQTHYAFAAGPVRFVAMNAFDEPHPGSFTVSAEQLDWVKQELYAATDAGRTKVLLLHCYPSDLKLGGGELREIIRTFGVSLVDMGHTHYNEIANDGQTLYAATRSTGQNEEGPVGYSVVNIDGGAVSWRFAELGRLPFVVITLPQDERLETGSRGPQDMLRVRAKVWGEDEAVQVVANLDGHTIRMRQIDNSQVWEARITQPPRGLYCLKVSVVDARGKIATDEIRVMNGDRPERARAERDQDNALEAWPEHGLLATQLGPNKNGRKW
jgi:Icc protein